MMKVNLVVIFGFTLVPNLVLSIALQKDSYVQALESAKRISRKNFNNSQLSF
jgi:hypothetical protein